jgi:NB-ARC domain
MPRSMGKLHGVPDLPPHYLSREADLVGLKQKLLSGDASVAITGRGQAVGGQGMGGIGKSVLAAALAHDSEVRQAFPDGIYWLTIGQKPNLLELQNNLLRQLTGSKETLTTEQEAKDALREALEGRTGTDNVHIHVAINKIHPRTLTLHDPIRDYITLKICSSSLRTLYPMCVSSRKR